MQHTQSFSPAHIADDTGSGSLIWTRVRTWITSARRLSKALVEGSPNITVNEDHRAQRQERRGGEERVSGELVTIATGYSATSVCTVTLTYHFNFITP